MPTRKVKKPDAPLSFHLRVWDTKLAQFVKKEAERNQRHQYQQVIAYLYDAMNRVDAEQESANGR